MKSPVSIDMSAVEGKIKEIIMNLLVVNSKLITYKSSFKNDMDADSLDMAELIMEFEDVFNITIPEGDAEEIKTFGDALDCIKKLKQNNR
jgi:acyl carrier protein